MGCGLFKPTLGCQPNIEFHRSQQHPTRIDTILVGENCFDAFNARLLPRLIRTPTCLSARAPISNHDFYFKSDSANPHLILMFVNSISVMIRNGLKRNYRKHTIIHQNGWASYNNNSVGFLNCIVDISMDGEVSE